MAVCLARLCPAETSVSFAQIKLTPGLMNEQRPAVGANDEWTGMVGAMSASRGASWPLIIG